MCVDNNTFKISSVFFSITNITLKHMIQIIQVSNRLMASSIVLLAVSITYSPIYAQDNISEAVAVIVGDPKHINENYDPIPDVSGTPLVGIRLGEKEGNIDVNQIEILIPPLETTEKYVCITNVTKDGRYSSENLYIIKSSKNDEKTARVQPFSGYKAELERYSSQDLAVQVFYSDTNACSAQNAVYLPQTVSNGSKIDTLFLMVNSRARITEASLSFREDNEQLEDSKQSIGGTCKTVCNNACLAFDKVCSFQSLKFPNAIIAKLTLKFDDGFDEDIHSYDLLLQEISSVR